MLYVFKITVEDLKKARAQFEIKPLPDQHPPEIANATKTACKMLFSLFNEAEEALNAGEFLVNLCIVYS
jgi:hypothetical protein